MDSMKGIVNPVEARTHALNVEGVFFQQRVAEILRLAGWRIVAEEYPVAFPPGNGPILGKEGRLDIRAEKQFNNYITVLAVECKKADPGYKEWVFFPKGEGAVEAPVVIRKQRPDAPEGSTGRDRWDIPTAVARFGTGLICKEARELKAEYGNPNSWKSTTKRIEEGCYQAAQATQALLSEIGRRQGLLMDRRMEPTVTTWIIPVVVTTADLLLCRFDPIHVSLETGQIDWNKVTYDPLDATALEYPLPVHLQLLPGDPLGLRPEEVHTFTKKHVFIVQGKSLEAFVQESSLGNSVAGSS
jgi:hypothetical protein